MKNFSIHSLFLTVFLLSACSPETIVVQNAQSPPMMVVGQLNNVQKETKGGILYIPSTKEKRRVPLIVVFSPDANAKNALAFWKTLADEFGFIVYASDEYKNDLNMPLLYPKVHQSIVAVLKEIEAGGTKLGDTYLAGMSGGASFSLAMNNLHPALYRGLILNTGRMWDDVLLELQEHEPSIKNKSLHPKRILMFASPTDFRYEEMKRDKKNLEDLGYQVKWVEFQGGHVLAPLSLYKTNLTWLLNGT